MKTLYIIGGTMGVGKTATCQILKKQLPDAVFLDGDWCWDADPFTVTEETKAMVLENIAFLLNQFLRCSAYENVIFCWVLHQQAILDDLLSRLEVDCRVHCVSLVCTAQALEARLQRDVDAGLRQPEVILRSLARIPLYEKLDTVKMDVSTCSAAEAAQDLAALSRDAF